jgi:hypothetical protein
MLPPRRELTKFGRSVLWALVGISADAGAGRAASASEWATQLSLRGVRSQPVAALHGEASMHTGV